ncbi:MAG TPA: helix-turn-helix domain-containing protein [Thermomicrobiaceae bacterium]|nr:helix-turn-helix domain-containing protein [Thermomicrobiaceae bacterium]
MKAQPNLAPIANLIGEPARATMLLELLGGGALTATELAARAEVAPSTASEHLARLVDGGLLRVEAQGRHRYYRLAGPEVARILEALGTLGRPVDGGDPFEHEVLDGLRFGRTCYDHLAGRLGVVVRDALVERGVLVEDGVEHGVTPAGEAWFAAFGIEVPAVRRARRSFARSCLDWSERRPHLAGALGAALLDRLVALGWVARVPGERMVVLTSAGRLGLARELGIRLTEPLES